MAEGWISQRTVDAEGHDTRLRATSDAAGRLRLTLPPAGTDALFQVAFASERATSVRSLEIVQTQHGSFAAGLSLWLASSVSTYLAAPRLPQDTDLQLAPEMGLHLFLGSVSMPPGSLVANAEF